ncbi:hypothetical protein LSTR_LSTR015586 [Laodelphax striatellus]|uniref:Uncharacterized protein n=1 Tax=Laodelphax striatellus TaxID=195883 RepID=A0A482WQN6_LAOST|nr:hypothetical protein LSTR_LSTR015586 [Laodelphax striatellus]
MKSNVPYNYKYGNIFRLLGAIFAWLVSNIGLCARFTAHSSNFTWAELGPGWSGAGYRWGLGGCGGFIHDSTQFSQQLHAANIHALGPGWAACSRPPPTCASSSCQG